MGEVPKFRWIVADSDWNRANYSYLIGRKYVNPPAYVQVKEISEEEQNNS
jgi:hypothetical protein